MAGIERAIHKRLAGPQPDLRGLRALVVGLGKSGSASVELLLREGASVVAYDADRSKETELTNAWQPRGVKLRFGELRPVEGIDFCVVSPGVPPFGAFFDWLRETDVPLLGELEFGCRFIQRPIIAVTGTNGKTTVVNMIAHILKTGGYNATATGNVGYPVAALAVEEARTGSDPLAMEISSYQCETMETFRPAVAVITNLAPDHLDRYPSIQAYYETKFRIGKNQAPNEALWMGPRVEGHCPAWIPSKRRTFDLGPASGDGLFYHDGMVIERDGSRDERRVWRAFKSYPPQMALNALAAVGATVSFGVRTAEALHALESFQPLPHRLEFAGEAKGLRCYNDSKATNVHALEAALNSLSGPIRLIAGGQAKGDSLEPVEALIREKVTAIYLIGEAAETLARAWRPLTEIHMEASIEDAVTHALRDGNLGEILLLSPACASWDQFADYAERGDRFKRAVKEFRG